MGIIFQRLFFNIVGYTADYGAHTSPLTNEHLATSFHSVVCTAFRNSPIIWHFLDAFADGNAD